jgi:hypothetical protein
MKMEKKSKKKLAIGSQAYVKANLKARKKNEFDNQLMITDDLNEMIFNDAIIL